MIVDDQAVIRGYRTMRLRCHLAAVVGLLLGSLHAQTDSRKKYGPKLKASFLVRDCIESRIYSGLETTSNGHGKWQIKVDKIKRPAG